MSGNTRFRLRLIFQEVDLWPGIFTIGRSHSCNLTIEDLKVSREHAKLVVGEINAVIHDLGSRNGIKVNGIPVKEHMELSNGDRVRLGDYEFVFVEDFNRPPSTDRPTIRTYNCPSCDHLYDSSIAECPECGNPTIVGVEGAAFKEPSKPKLGTTSSIRRRSGMINEVINMALSMEHFGKAAQLVDEKIGLIEKRGIDGSVDLDELEDLSELNLMLAKSLRDSARISWVLDAWGRAGAQLPRSLLLALEASSHDWHDLKTDLARYLSILERSLPGGADQDLLARIRNLL